MSVGKSPVFEEIGLKIQPRNTARKKTHSDDNPVDEVIHGTDDHCSYRPLWHPVTVIYGHHGRDIQGNFIAQSTSFSLSRQRRFFPWTIGMHLTEVKHELLP